MRESLVPAVSLKRVFKRIHNYIYANQGIQKDKAFEELLKIIFTKVFDERFSDHLQFYILPDEQAAEARLRIENVFRDVQRRYRYIFRGNEIIELKDSVLKYLVSPLYGCSSGNLSLGVLLISRRTWAVLVHCCLIYTQDYHILLFHV